MGRALGIALMLSIACGGAPKSDGPEAPTADPSEPAANAEPAVDDNGPDDSKLLERVDELVEEACECTIPECADDVGKRLTAWLDDKPEPSERDQELISDSHEMIDECRTAVDEPKDLLGFIEKVTNEMCECRDMTCAQDIQKRFMERLKDAPPASKADQRRIMELMQKMSACISQINRNP